VQSYLLLRRPVRLLPSSQVCVLLGRGTPLDSSRRVHLLLGRRARTVCLERRRGAGAQLLGELRRRDGLDCVSDPKICTGEYGNYWHYLMAGTVLAILPCLVLFCAFQRYFVEGIATSGLKG